MRSATRSILMLLSLTSPALAEGSAPTAGYLERVVQWTVQAGERCSDVARASYGSAKHEALVRRYNDVDCSRPLVAGTTLVLPAKVTVLPVAELRTMNPDVQARPPGGEWSTAKPGMQFFKNHLVSTYEHANANILFVDRSRIFLAEHTLVVIYDSAHLSSVGKASPTVELNEGELMAGIAALRGRPLTVASSGGEVEASSKDVVIRRKRERSIVSVFQGSAKLRAQGKSVSVPEGQGSSFTTRSAPTPPRPLPPAPVFGPDTSSDVVFGDAQGADVFLSWGQVPRAVAYRVELATSADFAKPLVREEVAADVLAFRAQHLPPATYFARVRAIDGEDFIGLPSVREVAAVTGREANAAALRNGRVRANRYASLTFETPPGYELAEGQGSFRACPCTVDFGRSEPTEVRLRKTSNTTALILPIDYQMLAAELTAAFDRHEVLVSVRLSGAEGIDVARVVRPKLRITGSSGTTEVPLGVSSNAAKLRLPRSTFAEAKRVDVVDGDDFLLGTAELQAPATPELRTEPDLEVGPAAPIFTTSANSDAAPWSLAGRSTASAGLVVSGVDKGNAATAAARLRLKSSLGRLVLDFGLTTPAVVGDVGVVSNMAWGGFSLALARPNTSFRLGPAFRLGVPLGREDPLLPEVALALEKRAGMLGFAANLGLRVATRQGSAFPSEQGYAVIQGSLISGARLAYASVDIHGLAPSGTIKGGISVGAEYGSRLFGGIALRLSPPSGQTGVLLGQIVLGLRSP